MSAAEQGAKPSSVPSPGKLGTITDSVGNVFQVVPAGDLLRSRLSKAVVAIDRYKSKSKPAVADPVIRDGVATFESASPFSLLFGVAPDLREPGRVYFQASGSSDRAPVWRVDVMFRGHKTGTTLDYEIYDPASGAKIDPSVIIIDPVVAMPFILSYTPDC